jgi:hypothetical protein
MKHLYATALVFTLFSQDSLPQYCKEGMEASAPDSHFVVNDQEVTDIKTGLIWQKCNIRRSGDSCQMAYPKRYTWSEALTAAKKERKKTGKAWRLPTVKEFLSITEKSCIEPSINLTIFPNTYSSGYWAASPDAKGLKQAWAVSFSYGNSYYYSQFYSNFIRLVRSE